MTDMMVNGDMNDVNFSHFSTLERLRLLAGYDATRQGKELFLCEEFCTSILGTNHQMWVAQMMPQQFCTRPRCHWTGPLLVAKGSVVMLLQHGATQWTHHAGLDTDTNIQEYEMWVW